MIPVPHASSSIESQKVTDILRQVTDDKDFTAFIARYDITVPIMIVKTFEQDVRELDDWLDEIVMALLAAPGSALYKDIEQSTVDDSAILNFLLGDANAAKRRSVWNPVGKYVERHLIDLRREDKSPYNRDSRYYIGHDKTDNGRYRDPVFVGVMYFDLMVKQALEQCVQWHMWLFFRN